MQWISKLLPCCNKRSGFPVTIEKAGSACLEFQAISPELETISPELEAISPELENICHELGGISLELQQTSHESSAFALPDLEPTRSNPLPILDQTSESFANLSIIKLFPCFEDPDITRANTSSSCIYSSREGFMKCCICSKAAEGYCPVCPCKKFCRPCHTSGHKSNSSPHKFIPYKFRLNSL